MSNRDIVTHLLKDHITYVSIIILVVGLNCRYSIPSMFPLLLRFDIKYFGGILFEMGVILCIGNWLIDKYKDDVNRRLFSRIIDQKLGLKSTPLLTELVHLIQPFAYHISLWKIECEINRRSESKSDKFDITQKLFVRLHPQQDNVHYQFKLASESENKPILRNIRLNGNGLIISRDVREVASNFLSGLESTTYQILCPLKND